MREAKAHSSPRFYDLCSSRIRTSRHSSGARLVDYQTYLAGSKASENICATLGFPNHTCGINSSHNGVYNYSSCVHSPYYFDTDSAGEITYRYKGTQRGPGWIGAPYYRTFNGRTYKADKVNGQWNRTDSVQLESGFGLILVIR